MPVQYRLQCFGEVIWLGTARCGQTETLRTDFTTVHLSIGGRRLKTVPSRLSEVDRAGWDALRNDPLVAVPSMC